MKALKHLNKYFYKYRIKLFLGFLITIIARIFSLFAPRLIGNSLTAVEKYLKSESLDFEKINKGLKDLTTLTDIVSQIRGNISRAESDLGDAHSNVNNLEGQLKDSVQTLKKELKK